MDTPATGDAVQQAERILSIAETTAPAKWGGGMEGYEVVTDRQRITLMIQGGQDCCENAGYFMSEDDVQSFVGADLLGVKLADTQLNDAMLERHGFKAGDEFYGGIMFVTLETSRGPLQFVAYNEQNGYYGHEARITSAQLTHEETL